jgi:UDP-N-acetylmuramoylalanine--D-glutamate ligase
MTFKLTQKQQRALFPLSHQNILILGAGREGLSTYQFLRQAFPRKVLSVADALPSGQWSDTWQDFLENDSNLRFHSGENYLSSLDKFQVIFRTPGIPPFIPPLQEWLAADPRHTLTSNTDLFFKLCSGITVGITGTKGKSTTASLVFHLLSRSGIKSVLVGNIGLPPLSVVTQITPKTAVVMELSSHQIQDLKVSPHIAIMHDVTREHLDYYPDFKTYVESKRSITAYQTKKDFLIYNPDFAIPSDFAKHSQATPITFSVRDTDGDATAFCQKQTVFYRDFSFTPPRLESVVNLKFAKLKGSHNRQNILPAVIVAKFFKLTGEQINAALKTFSPLRHRLEWIAKIDNTDFYNDSLSTTPESMVAALKAFSKQSIILLAGGFERHQDYTPAATYLATHPNITDVILFPTTGQRLEANTLEAVTKINSKPAVAKRVTSPTFHHVTTMKEAVQLAAQLTISHSKESIVLLSPGAASFGEFRDYADRGDQFATAVKGLL